jgi:hypothetical protein
MDTDPSQGENVMTAFDAVNDDDATEAPESILSCPQRSAQ